MLSAFDRKVWSEIVQEVDSTVLKTVNVKSKRRSLTIKAIAKYIEWLEGNINDDTLPNPPHPQTPDPRP